ncbi:MAG: PqqD family protein [Clostridia bacterium]|nr:PqqD family protein [Clostridia bacterium]
MKLKEDFIIQEIDGTHFLVPLGGEAFNGVVRGNETTAFILHLLSDEISEEQIVECMLREFDAPREVVEEDVRLVLDTLRSVGAIMDSE